MGNERVTVTKLKLVKGTPIIYIDDTIIQGFNSADTTGKEIEKLIDVAKAKDKVNTLDEYVANGDYSKISSNGSALLVAIHRKKS